MTIGSMKAIVTNSVQGGRSDAIAPDNSYFAKFGVEIGAKLVERFQEQVVRGAAKAGIEAKDVGVFYESVNLLSARLFKSAADKAGSRGKPDFHKNRSYIVDESLISPVAAAYLSVAKRLKTKGTSLNKVLQGDVDHSTAFSQAFNAAENLMLVKVKPMR